MIVIIILSFIPVETLEIPFKCSQIKLVLVYTPFIPGFPNSLRG